MAALFLHTMPFAKELAFLVLSSIEYKKVTLIGVKETGAAASLSRCVCLSIYLQPNFQKRVSRDRNQETGNSALLSAHSVYLAG